MTDIKVGSLWNNRDFDIIVIDERYYVLNMDKWNGFSYHSCWEVHDVKGLDAVDDTTYIITPIYNYNGDEIKIVGYNIA